MTTEGCLEALRPRSGGVWKDTAARDAHRRGLAEVDVEGVILRDWLRADREVVRVGLACGGVLMAWLSPILKSVTHEYVPGCAVRSCSDCTGRLDGTTNYARISVQLSQLGFSFLNQWLASMRLALVPREAVISTADVGTRVRTALSTSWKRW